MESASELVERHERYLKNYSNDESGPEQIMAEYLKMSGMYWGLNALYIMGSLDDASPQVLQVLEFIKKCQGRDGGFSAAPGHDSHILHTLSAVQILAILGRFNPEFIDTKRCLEYVRSLQQEDGSFYGDEWGEVDTRFSFCALATLKLIGHLESIDLNKAAEFIMSCNNQIDGGFGSKPGSESHSAYVYCCVGSLAILGQLDRLDKDHLGWWLSERQVPSGGLNGRPEKLPDLCYSWWCLSSMKMIDQMHRIDCKKLVSFILACQDEEQGGFSDRPGNWTDPYHTMFGVASLSLISQHIQSNPKSREGSYLTSNTDDNEYHEFMSKLGKLLKPVDPILCMPI